MEKHVFRLSKVQPDEKYLKKTVDILLIMEICTIALEIAWNKFQIRVSFYHSGIIWMAETIIYVVLEYILSLFYHCAIVRNY